MPAAQLPPVAEMVPPVMLMFPQDEGMGNFPDWCSWVVFAGCLFGLWKKVNPILLLLLSALFGIGIYGVAGWFV